MFQEMELFELNLQKFLYFLKLFVIFLEMKPYTFRPKLKTLKTSSPPPPKKLLILQGIELSSSKIKKFLIFQEMELPNSNTKKNYHIFSK